MSMREEISVILAYFHFDFPNHLPCLVYVSGYSSSWFCFSGFKIEKRKLCLKLFRKLKGVIASILLTCRFYII